MTAQDRRRLIIQSSLFCGAVLAGWLAREAWPASDHPVPVSSRPPPATVFELEKWSNSVTSAEAVANDLTAPNPAPVSAIAIRLLETRSGDPAIWAVVFAAWCATTPEDAWAFAKENSEAFPRINLSRVALEQWAKVDPEAARAAVPDPTEEQLEALLEGAMAADIEAGFALLEELLAQDANAARAFKSAWWMRESSLEALALNNPAAALKWVERIDDSDLLGPVLSGWWKQDPTSARNWLSQQANREEILMDAGWFLSNNAEAYHPEIMDLVLTSVPPGNRKSEMLQQTLEALAYADPDVALRETNRLLTDPATRAEAVGKIASIVARADFSKAWDILDGLDPSVLSIRRVSLPRIEVSEHGVAENLHSPHHYAGGLTSMRGLESPAAVRSRMLTDLLLVDKQAALKFMEGLPSDQLTRVGERAIEAWAWRDPEEAAAWLAGKLGNTGDTYDLPQLFRYPELNRGELLKLVDSLPQGTVRTAMAMAAVDDLAIEDPQAAFELARDSGAAPELIRRVYYQWSLSDPERALEHIAARDSAPPDAWKTVVKKTFDRMPEETARAVGSLPAGPTRDTAVSAIVREVMTNPAPVPATEWALCIGDGKLRRKAIESVLERTTMDLRLTRDPEVASAMRDLLSSDATIPEEERTRWLQSIETEFRQP